MINIPMKSKAPFDQTNISSINDAVTHSAVSAQNVETINLWKAQEQAAGNQQGYQATQPGYPNQAQAPYQSQPQPGYPNQPQAPYQSQPQPGYSNQPQAPYQSQPQSGYPNQPQAPYQSQPQPGYSNQPQAPYQSQPQPGYSNQTQPAYQAGGSSNQAQPAYQAGASQNPAPIQKPIPQLLKPIQKGQKVTLGVGIPLTALKVCFGWNSTNAACDVDVSAFMLGMDGRVIGDEWFVFYGQTNSPDNSTIFRMDNGADREIIDINLQTLNPTVKKIVFVLTINEALEKRLHFGMMKDAYVRILDPHTNSELVSFKMTDYYSNVISMMIGEVYQHNGTWKFNAVGNGVAKDLMGLCELYGVQVMD